MLTTIVRELGIMHIVFGLKSYKTALGVVTQVLHRINELLVQVGDVQCMMNFMVLDINNYDILLGLYFLIKMGAVVVEKGMIQIK
jgi:hypothetical protein